MDDLPKPIACPQKRGVPIRKPVDALMLNRSLHHGSRQIGRQGPMNHVGRDRAPIPLRSLRAEHEMGKEIHKGSVAKRGINRKRKDKSNELNVQSKS